MREQMRLRGPDGHGQWQSDDNRIGLAHRRLAIIDLSDDGKQPMHSADRRHVIVFNGEIYNYRELRRELESQGCHFHSQSDTEVLLHLYRRDGVSMCRKLRGMYAFAIWSVAESELFMARDPFGIKPLYLTDDGRTLRFASQVRSLLAGGKCDTRIDAEGEAGYWIWGHVPEPYTLFAGIKAFEPGRWMLIRRGGQRSGATFDSVAALLTAEPTPDARAGDLQFDSLRAAVLDSVRHHLVADVPVGVFLSAGIDSATLAALATECGGQLQTVTLGFEEYRGTPLDETVLAEELAQRLGTRHQTVWIGKSEFRGAFESFMTAMDQPTIDGLNTWLVSRAASACGLKVALSGLGGDEMFGSYPSFRELPRIRALAGPFARIPGLGRTLRRLTLPLVKSITSPKYASLLEYGGSWEGAYMLRRALRLPWEMPACADRWPAAHIDPDFKPSCNHAMVSLLESTHYMRNQLLRDSDWAGMAHSLEIRVPLVDVQLTRYLAQVMPRAAGLCKRDLALTAGAALPRRLVMRPKSGFVVPVRDWMTAQSGVTRRPRGLRGWQQTVRQCYA
jgi:asparagine synthase (glutamine-hydrolysing)